MHYIIPVHMYIQHTGAYNIHITVHRVELNWISTCMTNIHTYIQYNTTIIITTVHHMNTVVHTVVIQIYYLITLQYE